MNTTAQTTTAQTTTAYPSTADLIDRFAGEGGGAGIAELRRPVARQEAQRSHDSLFSPVDDAEFPVAERWVLASFATRLTADDATAAHYAEGARREADSSLVDAVLAAAEEAAVPGPYGAYPEPGLAAESTDGLRFTADDAAYGARLAAALEYAHLLVKRPREATGAHHQRLLDAGWSVDGIVTLSQLVAFLAFQQRVAAGLRVLAASETAKGSGGGAEGDGLSDPAAVPGSAVGGLADPTLAPSSASSAASSASAAARASGGDDPSRAGARARDYDLPHPDVFTREVVGWVPWLDPLPREELTERHWEGLVDRPRADFPYFRLLARDPEVLRARTLTDKDIFFNDEDGLPRAERELAAAAASRVNGCVFCASVHARAAAQLSDRAQDVDRLLAEGVGADLGERWNAIVSAAAALTRTPVAFGPEHVRALREAGLGRKEIVDVVQSAAFFNWANRLMLTVGRAVAPGVKLPR